MQVLWATTTAEQQHASVTLMRRRHPDFEMNTLLARAGIHAMRRLIPYPSAEDRHTDQLRKKLDQIASKVPGRCGGRMMFMKELCEAMKDKASRSQKAVPRSVYQTITRKHGRRWAGLSAVHKARYEAMAEKWQGETSGVLA